MPHFGVALMVVSYTPRAISFAPRVVNYTPRDYL